MFSFRASGKKHSYGALIDIDSGSVGVAIVESIPGENIPKLIYTRRVLMRVTKNTGKGADMRKVRETLLSAGLILAEEGRNALLRHNKSARVGKLYVTCAAPWSYTIARHVHYENDESFKVTDEIIDDLVESAEEEILSHLEEDSRVTQDGYKIVERISIDVAINDYPVQNPRGLEGTMLSLSHITGVVPHEIISTIEEIQEKLFPGTELRMHTYMLTSFCVMRDIFPRTNSLCVIDVTGEATEFGIVENNLLIENIFTPYGSNSLVRDIMEKTGKPATDVLTHLRAFTDNSHIAESDLVTYGSMYEEQMVKAVNLVLERRAFPNDIIITAQREHAAFFKHTLTEAIKKGTGNEPSVHVIDPALLDQISVGAENDVYLAIAARFFHKLHRCGETPE